MTYILVSHRRPKNPSFCALCCEAIEDGYLRELATRLLYCDQVCYGGHCKVAIVALEHRARAS
jgi:hypothetical protein